MVDASQVAALLFQVRSATSPVAKVRAVMQAWRVIRAMPPHDRKKVAMELGFDGAEGLVDRVASEHGGLPPEQIKDALRAAGSSDPSDVERLVGELRDPATRSGAVQRGIEKLEYLLTLGSTSGTGGSEGDAPPEPVGDDEAAGHEPDADAAEEKAGEAEAEEAGAAAEPASTPPPPPTATVAAAAATGAPAVAAAEPTRKAATPSTPPRKPPAGRPPQGRTGRAGTTVVAAVPAATVPPAVVRRPPQPSPPAVRDDAWASFGRRGTPAQPELAPPSTQPELAVERAPGILARLRELRSDPESLRGASTAELRTLVEGCGPEWARRRALLALIEAGALNDADVAVELISDLSSPAARRWCLNAFARATTLDVEARERAGAALGL